MPTAKINGKDITVKDGTTILQAALANGIHIPHFCYHPSLKIDGNCRMCLVEVEKMPKLTIACNTTLTEGMNVNTNSEKVIKARRGVIEFVLTNHPLDCPVCDKAGECVLQNYAYTYGSGTSRFEEDKTKKPKKDLGDHILIYSQRCVLCSRCVRFCKDISGTGELGIINRGGKCEIDIFEGRKLNNKLAGNVVDICPVGALTSKDFLFKMRVWYLTRHETVCNRCSAGCNITVEVNDNKIYRVTPRSNPQVNDFWICDEGRYGWDNIHGDTRLISPLKKEVAKQIHIDWTEALNIVKENLAKAANNSDSIAGVLSSGATNEENFMLARLMRDIFKSKNISIHNKSSEGSDEKFPTGFVISADKNPNYKGASDMLQGAGISFNEFLAAVKSGKIKYAYILNGRNKSQFSKDEIDTLKKLEFLIVQDTHQSDLSSIANIVLPNTIFLEMDGTFTNSKGIVQRINKAINPPAKVRNGWETIKTISALLGQGINCKSHKEVFGEIVNTIPAYHTLSFEKIGKSGVKI